MFLSGSGMKVYLGQNKQKNTGFKNMPQKNENWDKKILFCIKVLFK
jgi:hypothetical protein